MGLNKQQFIEQLNLKYDEPFKLLEYYGTSKSGKYECGYCKQQYELYRMGKLLSVNRKHICTHCFASQYAEQVLQRIAEIDTLEFVQFSYKENLHKPTVIYKCLNCGELTEKPYVEFLKYSTCIHCGENAKRMGKTYIDSLMPTDYKIVGEYDGIKSKALIRHKCGFIFKTVVYDVIRGHSNCPKCRPKMSQGEKKILNFLEENNIQYTKEKVFNWSQSKRYDFYLPDYNLLIEYNGIQHYKEVPHFHLTLEEQQQIDSWKVQQAHNHNIDILIIPYTNFNEIETILVQRLKETT